MWPCPASAPRRTCWPARRDPELFMTFMTFAAPATVLAVSMADGAVREVGRPASPWTPTTS